jgi:regulator of protease activity HflC (stomatin/prohibitin superfamily)
MSNLLFVLVLAVVVLIVLTSSLKIAGESERFAVFILGRFQAFKGPGLSSSDCPIYSDSASA